MRMHGMVLQSSDGRQYRIFEPPWWRLDCWVAWGWWKLSKRAMGTIAVSTPWTPGGMSRLRIVDCGRAPKSVIEPAPCLKERQVVRQDRSLN